jgi:hypothetical protein
MKGRLGLTLSLQDLHKTGRLSPSHELPAHFTTSVRTLESSMRNFQHFFQPFGSVSAAKTPIPGYCQQVLTSCSRERIVDPARLDKAQRQRSTRIKPLHSAMGSDETLAGSKKIEQQRMDADHLRLIAWRYVDFCWHLLHIFSILYDMHLRIFNQGVIISSHQSDGTNGFQLLGTD